MINLKLWDKAAANTFKCTFEEHNHFWCYICNKCLNKNNADIDHIKPQSDYAFNINKSSNNGLGVVKAKWLKFFLEENWKWNNLVLVHKQCNNEIKDNKDFTNKYINIIREEYDNI